MNNVGLGNIRAQYAEQTKNNNIDKGIKETADGILEATDVSKWPGKVVDTIFDKVGSTVNSAIDSVKDFIFGDEEEQGSNINTEG